MKNNITKKIMKLSAVFASSLIAASATGITVSANAKDAADAVTNGQIRFINHTKKNTMSVAAGEASLSLIAQESKPGDLVEVPIILNAKNECKCYDVDIEFDSRLELEAVEGAKAYCEFEESGRKFACVINYQNTSFVDNETTAVLKFRVPRNAVNGDYFIKFNEVHSFSDDEGDFAGFRVDNAVINVTGGVEKKSGSIELRSVIGLAGGTAVVQVIPVTGDTCTCYDFVLEYDSRLTLDVEDISGANSYEIFQRDGKNYVSLVGYTTSVYEDGKPMAALNFHLPDDAVADDDFNVKMSEVKTFSTEKNELEAVTPSYAEVSVVDCDSPDDYKTYLEFAKNGAIIGSSVGLKGDANQNGKTDVRDAAAVALYLASHGTNGNIDDMGKFLADVDDDGKLSVRDSAKIARYVANGCIKW